jgi:hypothetical protein
MKNFIAIAFASFFFMSCEEVIDLQLKTSEPQYVIQGFVNEGDSSHFVKISKTVPFDQTNVFPLVNGAVVTLSDDQGNTATMAEDSAGYYSAKNFPAFGGRKYVLLIEHEGNEFEASSSMPFPVALTDVFLIPGSGFSGGGFLVVPQYVDPAEFKNYYAFQTVVIGLRNDKLVYRETKNLLRDDELTNGQSNQQPLFEIGGLQKGDTMYFEMHGISASANLYYFSKNQNTDPNSGAPANPVSNFSNGALGYFSARTVKDTLIVVPG